MKFSGTRVYGFESAVIGMRLPLSKDYEDAYQKSDSTFVLEKLYDDCSSWIGERTIFKLGTEDLKLARRLINADDKGKAGEPNSKFLQMIEVWVCIEAPLAFWKEADTYRHSVKNSTSTMHRVQKYEITEECFEKKPNGKLSSAIDIKSFEKLRLRFNEIEKSIKDESDKEKLNLEYIKKLRVEQKDVWYDLIYGLPDSWLQSRMWHFNYATLRNICSWRSNHKQNTWSGKDNPNMENFISWAKSLPYAEELIFCDKPILDNEILEEVAKRG